VELGVWKLEDTPGFKAISYAWGNPERNRQIFVGGKPRQVRFNCYYALWQVRLNGNCLYVWMDALCINQQDNQEKGVQVQMMGALYAAASEVLACIGPGAEDVEFLAQFDPLQNDRWASSQTNDFIDFILSNGDDFYSRFLDAYWALNCRPYWNRVWIGQELAKAKARRVLCGRSFLSWRCIDTIAKCDFSINHELYNEKSRRLREQHPPRLLSMTGWSSGQITTTLSGLVYDLGSMECENPRDHIYGLLGLITQAHDGPVIVPNYDLHPYELALQVMTCVEPWAYTALLSSLNINAQNPTMQNLVTQRQRQSNAVADVEVSQQSWPRFTDMRYLRIKLSADGHLTLWPPDNSRSSVLFKDDHAILEDMNADPTLGGIVSCLAKKLFAGGEYVGLLCSETRPGDILVGIHRDIDELALVMRRRTATKYQIIGQGFFYARLTARALWGHPPMRMPECIMNLSAEDYVALFGQDLAAAPGSYRAPADRVDGRGRIRRLTTNVADPETNPSPMAWFERPIHEADPVD
jgi:hypothetical protein